jgi:diamine N-acetyltransferase
MNKKKSLITYRFATNKDLNELSLLSKELMDLHKKYGWYYSYKKNYLSIMRKKIKFILSSKKSFSLVAEENNKIVGFSLVELSNLPNESFQIYNWKKEAEVIDLFVIKKYRDNKIGENLLEKSISVAKSKGVDVVRVVIDYRNTLAKKFYKKNGMDLYDEVFVKRLK